MSSGNGWSNGMPQIGIIGAGMSGMCAAVQLRKKLAITSFTIFEKNSDVGGVWLSNTYPDWSENYASQPEILDYLKGVARKHKLYEHIKFQHEVKSCTWNDDLNKWTVRYVNTSIPNAGDETQLFDILILAFGGLRIPNIPNELKAFKGPTMHTAEWNHEIDLKNKKVAVVGSGASAVQVIPSIVDDVHSLHCYQRKPAYILPRAQFVFPIFLKKIFFYIPFIMWLYRCLIYLVHEQFQKAFRAGSQLNKTAHRLTKRYRRRELIAHRHLWNDLTPKYGFGCKQVNLSEKYYAAMTRHNLRVHSSHIDKIVNQTIYTKDGRKEEIDVLILATGFKVQDFFSPMQLFGKCGQNIRQSWVDKEPRSYYGIVSNATPNFFFLFGPHQGLAHNSAVFMIECQVNFVINAVREMMHRNARLINVKVSAEDEFMDKLKRDLESTVWYKEDCGSWHVNARGVITILWGDNCTNYWKQTRTIDWSKFDIK